MPVRRQAPDIADYLKDDDDEDDLAQTSYQLDDEQEEDPDELPARSSIVQRGWDAAKKMREEDSEYTKEFKFSEESKLVKFLSSDPFVFRQHWVQERGQGKKKSFVCLGEDCPLCRIGHSQVSTKSAFPVVNLSEPGMPVQILISGVRLTRQLEKAHSDPKTGPLEKLFWDVSKQGESKDTTYQLYPVKPRDLIDYEVNPQEVGEVLAKIKPLGPEAIYVSSEQELQDVADEIAPRSRR